MRRFVDLLALTFFSAMLLLTVFARRIHQSMLPHVEVITVKNQDFICTFYDADGNECTTLRRAPGIPKCLQTEDLYVIIEGEVYGEVRQFATRAVVQFNELYNSEAYYAVASGLQSGDLLVVSGSNAGFTEPRTEVYYDGD